MISAIDTSVISAIWTGQANFAEATSLLGSARGRGGLVISGMVYAELLAHPTVEPATADAFFAETGIGIDCGMDQTVWHHAGMRYRSYAIRRISDKLPRRMVADFVIGAHALFRTDGLITFNGSDFRRDFPELRVLPER